MIAVYYENDLKHINTVCVESVALSCSVSGTYCYHCTVEGWIMLLVFWLNTTIINSPSGVAYS